LGFKAEVYIQNNEGLLPIDIAIECNRTEIVRILEFWKLIRKQYIHNDFDIQWRYFLTDLNSVISSEKSAEKTLFELRMKENFQKQQLLNTKITFKLDDDYIRDAMNKAIIRKKIDNNINLRNHAEEISKIKNVNINKIDIDRSPWMLNSKIKDKAKKNKIELSEKDKYYHYLLEKEHKLNACNNNGTNIQDFYKYVKDQKLNDDEVNENEVNEVNEEVNEVNEEVTEVNESEVNNLENKNEKSNIDNTVSRPLTNYAKRRLQSANKVKLDGMFELFTTRPCTSSPFMQSKRDHDAPLIDTPEEFNVARYLSTPNKIRDKIVTAVVKEKTERKSAFRSSEFVLLKTQFGSYSTALEYAPSTDREILFSKLVQEDGIADNIAKATLQASLGLSHNNNKESQMFAKKVDMVDGKRSRFVDSKLLPPIQSSVYTSISNIKNDSSTNKNTNTEQDSTNDKSKSNNSNNSNNKKTDKINHTTSINKGETTPKKSEKNEHDANKSNKSPDDKLFVRSPVLSPPKVVYGVGRLTSTHRMKEKLQYPWNPKPLG
jgi:hypothetical protein